jgi:endonuclease III
MTITRNEYIRRVAADIFRNDMARKPKDRTPLDRDQANTLLISCLCNRSIQWERAMSLVDEMKARTGYTDTLKMFAEQTPDMIAFDMFAKPALHRYHYMADYCHAAMCTVRDEWDGSVLNYWKDEPSASQLMARVMDLRGFGEKTASLFCRLAVLSHGVVLWDKYSGLEVSPDVHVRTVMQRLGLVGDDATAQDVMNAARVLSPMCPVDVDGLFCVGLDFCKSSHPLCRGNSDGEPCPLAKVCPSAK